MGVWRIPDRRNDIDRFYPKAPYVEKRKCKAFRCRNRRSVSFPWVKKNPWCTDHSIQVYFAAGSWMAPGVASEAQRAATPATNFFTYVWKRVWHGQR